MFVHFLFMSYVCNKTYIWCIKIRSLKKKFYSLNPFVPTKMSVDIPEHDINPTD